MDRVAVRREARISDLFFRQSRHKVKDRNMNSSPSHSIGLRMSRETETFNRTVTRRNTENHEQKAEQPNAPDDKHKRESAIGLRPSAYPLSSILP
jgi:hypothetical protein